MIELTKTELGILQDTYDYKPDLFENVDCQYLHRLEGLGLIVIKHTDNGCFPVLTVAGEAYVENYRSQRLLFILKIVLIPLLFIILNWLFSDRAFIIGFFSRLFSK